jgi:competence protein ComEC
VTGGTEPRTPAPPDLRLAGFALATWVGALACLHLSSRTGFGVAAVALTGAVAGIVMGRGSGTKTARAVFEGRTPALLWIAVVILLGAGCGSVATAVRVGARDAGPLTALLRESATVQADLVVRDDPRPVLGSAAGRSPTYVVAVDLTGVQSEDTGVRLRLDVRALVLGTRPEWRSLLPGQRATASGRLLAPRGGDLRAAVLAVRSAPTLHGEPPWPQRAAGALRSGLQRACGPLPERPGGLLPGLVVGDTSRLDPGVDEDFRTTGMTHLTAVSGANVR